ncbi:DIP1281 family NlpC/P60 protein [Corynebacterium sp.]|uniref:DIP1281 family NlpC/P60 protein n=1 Tax=Corynebacterium sp. TaxID=1720 RepID=UPI0026DC415F|nr:NlpC/P60 family protein [Corynebacterium sp.]MDO5077439.1 NlpC/P60 family protein [Corynebacterium sp.]
MNRRFHNVATKIVATAICASGLTLSAPVAAQPTNPDDAAIAEADREVNANTGEVSKLVTSISETDAEVNRLENEMGGLREAVNKAVVDLHDAQNAAETARQESRQARDRLQGTQDDITAAQAVLDEISRAAYRRGASAPGVAGAAGNTTTDDALDRQTYLRTSAEKQRKAIERLEQLRTQAANEESTLRRARQNAEQREAEAQQARDLAEQNIARNTSLLQAKHQERAGLIAARTDAERRLAIARANVDELGRQRAEYQEFLKAEEERKAAAERAEAARREAEVQAEEQRRREAEAKQAQEQADATQAAADREAAQQRAQDAAAAAAEAKQRAEEENAQAIDAEALQQAALAAAALAAEALIQANTPQHQTLDNPYPTTEDADDTLTFASETDGTYQTLSQQASAGISGSREEKIELVISRGLAQVGTPYAWGGGDASGPTQGIRDGGVADSHGDFNKVGFDCSGLVVYAFAGAGISLPHYTGYQYSHGTKIDPSSMQRGDLIFYGPNAEHHVAIYLGDGTMLEAPQSGSAVQVSPVRWSGMSPYAVRLI